MKSIYFIILINFISASQFISNEISIPDQQNKLIFIYNASNDYLSVAFDFTHKIISPKTYQCSLCKVTYGAFKMHKKWKEYLDSINLEVIFLYKNNYKKYFPNLEVEDFPCSFLYDGKSNIKFLDKTDFDSCENLDELIELVNIKLEYKNAGIQKH